ncbi:MAG: rhomboid family intramembrane serine protease [Planctomycetota bacterium]
MFLPIGDAPNPPGRPLVNNALIAINVAVYLLVALPLGATAADPNDPALAEYVRLVQERAGQALNAREIASMVSAYDLVVYRFGFRPAEPSVLGLLTSMFLHGGFFHLAGNMLFLWIYGDNVEHRLGRLRYLLAYLGTGVAATVAHALFALESNTPMVGASGAISGVLGFYFLFFPRNTVRVFMVLFPFFVNVIVVPARIVLGFYIVVSNIIPFLLSNPGGGGVAYGAHLGGFAAGLAIAAIVDRWERDATPREYRSARTAVRETSAAEKIADLVRRGDLAQAAQAYFGAPDHEADRAQPRDVLVIGRWLSENDHAQAALSTYRRVLRAHPSGALAADAHLGAGLVQLKNLGRPTSAYQHFLDVIDLAPGSEAADIAREGLAFIDSESKR